MKKICSILLSVIISATAFSTAPFAVSAAESKQSAVGESSGTTGDCTWTLDDENTLVISGNGEMEDEINNGPWGYSVRKVIINSGVTNIGDHVFSNCYFLNSVTIPESVKTIGYCSFNGCPYLESITIPKGVTLIKGEAFSMCDSLASMTVDPNNKVYDSRNDCNAIIETKTNTLVSGCKETKIPSSVKEIGSCAFRFALTLYSIDIPGNVNGIGEYAFDRCLNLKTVTIGNGVTRIDDNAFDQCFDLESVTIPGTVTSIGDCVFQSCSNLTIYGEKGSVAESYANENNIPFKEIGAGPQVLIGDSNGDGTVDILDATTIQKHAVGKASMTNEQLDVADVNNDGIVDILDAAEIQKYVVGKVTEFKKKA